jgi:hypothetical protein
MRPITSLPNMEITLSFRFRHIFDSPTRMGLAKTFGKGFHIRTGYMRPSGE